MPKIRQVEHHRAVNVTLPNCGQKLIDYPPARLQKAISREERARRDRESMRNALGFGLLQCGVVILLCAAVILLYVYIISKGI